MASGVKLHEDCIGVYNKLKTKHELRYFTLKVDGNAIVPDQVIECSVKDDKFDCYDEFLQCLPEKGCRYGAFEYAGRQDTEGKKTEKLVFVSWAPDTASIKDKMVHSASLAAVKSKLNVKDVIQASDLTELDEDTICEKVHVKIDKEHLKQQRECHRMHQMGQVQQMEGDH